MDKSRFFDAPIPGENYTSDTKNYPWHRPPQHTDLDSAIEDCFTKLTSEDSFMGLLTMIEMGVDIVSLTDMFVTAGIGAGKWTPDFAILLAGPVSHIIYLMAKGYGIECEMGLTEKKKPVTKAFWQTMKEIDGDRAGNIASQINLEGIKEAAERQPQSGGGFMGAAPTQDETQEPETLV